MTALDRQLLAERAATLERHLERIATHLPARPEDLAPGDACDVVILHLWQAVQLVIDLALSACSDLRLGTPASYADAFSRLASAGKLDAELVRRLARAAGLRNLMDTPTTRSTSPGSTARRRTVRAICGRFSRCSET